MAAGVAKTRASAQRIAGDFAMANAAWLETSVTTLAASPTMSADGAGVVVECGECSGDADKKWRRVDGEREQQPAEDADTE
jgi:hypothetical protein